MIGEIREARSYDCGRLARTLRAQHKALLVGRDVHRDLRQSYDQSFFCGAWVVDGRVLAIGGLTGTAASSEGDVWLAISERAARLPHALVRRLQTEIDKMLLVKWRLSTVVLRDDRPALRLAYFLGFRATGSVVIDGIDTLSMTIERPFSG